MTLNEQSIIWKIEEMPKSEYGDYLYTKELYRAIAQVMHYPIVCQFHGWFFRNLKDHEKTTAIVLGMQKRGIIKLSKSGQMFKYLGVH